MREHFRFRAIIDAVDETLHGPVSDIVFEEDAHCVMHVVYFFKIIESIETVDYLPGVEIDVRLLTGIYGIRHIGKIDTG